MMNSQLKDNTHINTHIAKKSDNLLPYMKYTLAKHHDIKRIEFFYSFIENGTAKAMTRALMNHPKTIMIIVM